MFDPVSYAMGAKGGGGGSSDVVLLVIQDPDTGVLDKTWQEIHDAMGAGQIPVIAYSDGLDAGITIIGWASFVNDVYGLWGYGDSLQGDPWYGASSADGYPSN